MRRIFTVIIVTWVLIQYAAVSATAWQIPISEAENHSRYVFEMKDRSGNLYMVYIYSNDEQRLIGHTWFAQRPAVYEGNYYAALVPKGSRMAMVQDIYLFGLQDGRTKGIFDMTDPALVNAAYIVRTPYENQPDLLVVAQRQFATAADMRVFFVEDGTLYLTYWRHQNGGISKTVGASWSYPIKCTDYLTFNTGSHVRSMEYTGNIYKVWKLDPDARIFNYISMIYDTTKWPR